MFGVIVSRAYGSLDEEALRLQLFSLLVGACVWVSRRYRAAKRERDSLA